MEPSAAAAQPLDQQQQQHPAAKVMNDPSGPSVTLTIRLMMQGKEVGSIIGKKGDNIKKFREESGAKINISDGSCPERIVTVTGPTDGILKAFSLISAKFEEDSPSLMPPPPSSSQHQHLHHHSALGHPQQHSINSARPLVTLRLIVPASQCGSLIGKGGAKIKEIREITGATIQVASEMLPNSTERAVTISGTADGITKCIYQICCVMLESPPKGATIPYRPKPAMPPVIFAGGQAYTIQGQYAIPHPDLTKLHQLALQHAPLVPGASAAAAAAYAGLSLAAAAPPPPAPPQMRQQQQQHQPPPPQTQNPVTGSSSQEMSIPNELIGCIIGKGGAKINEIRQLSGATIKISNTEEGSKDRTVVISGTPEAVNLAQYLIETSMELHKNLSTSTTTTSTTSPAVVDPNSMNTDTTTSTCPISSNSSSNPLTTSAAIPLTQLVPKPLVPTSGPPPPSHAAPPGLVAHHHNHHLPNAAHLHHPSLTSLAAAAHHLHHSLFAAGVADSNPFSMPGAIRGQIALGGMVQGAGGNKALVTKVRSPAVAPMSGLENGGGIGGKGGKADRKFAPY